MIDGGHGGPRSGDGEEPAPLADGSEFLRQIKALSTPEDYARLLAACGGRRLYVPAREPTPDSWISVAIGHEKACALISNLRENGHFYGLDITIPSSGGGAYFQFTQANHEKIVAGLKAGKSLDRIAYECRLTRRGVQKHVKKMRDRGEIIERDWLRMVAMRYLSPSRGGDPLTEAKREATAQVTDAELAWMSSTIDWAKLGLGGGSPGAQVGALIEKAHGPEVFRLICAAGRGKPITIGIVRGPHHPFRAALDERQAYLLAALIKACGYETGDVLLADADRGKERPATAPWRQEPAGHLRNSDVVQDASGRCRGTRPVDKTA